MKTLNRDRKEAKLLLIASSGGHWVQINRVAPYLRQYKLHFASTESDYHEAVFNAKFYYIPDASQNSSKLKLIWLAVSALILIIRIRPDVVLSTGAAPGFFALFFGKKIGAKTIWLDSIANVDNLSLAGRKAKKYADLFLTQWEHLASPGVAEYHGSVV